MSSTSGKQALEQITKEREQEKETKMKNQLITVSKYIATVIITLALVAGGAALYFKGVSDGKAQQKQVNDEIASQVAASKDNQK